MTAEIHWEFAALREKQIQDQIARETAEVIQLALEGAPTYFHDAYDFSTPMTFEQQRLLYMTPPTNDLGRPSDSEPA